MWIPDVVLYHANCDDGLVAAWVAHNLYPDAKYIPVNYHEEPPYKEIATGSNVLIVDFSYKKDILIGLSQHVGAKGTIVILDHHETAQNELSVFIVDPDLCEMRNGVLLVSVCIVRLQRLFNNGFTDRAPIMAFFDMERSGAMLSWDFFHSKEEAPQLIRYVQDRDLWKKKLPYGDEFTQWLRSFDKDPNDPFAHISKIHQLLESNKGDAGVTDSYFFVEEASSIKRANDTLCKSLARQAWMIDYVQLDGPNLYIKDPEIELDKLLSAMKGLRTYPVLVVNAPHILSSDVCREIMELHNCKVAATFSIEGDNIRWSFRSSDDGPAVNTFCQSKGGGGHPHAAGYTLPLENGKITLG